MESGLDLAPEEAQALMREVLEDRSDKEVLKSFLLTLKNKGETAEEVSALVQQMYLHCAPITITERAVDTVGTGGDGAHTINISTTAAIIAARRWISRCKARQSRRIFQIWSRRSPRSARGCN